MNVAAVLVAQYAGTLSASGSTTVDMRASQPAPIVGSAPNLAPGQSGRDVLSGDVMIGGSIRLGLTNRRTIFSLSYSESVGASSVELGLTPVFSQGAGASIGWHDRLWGLTFSESGSYSRISAAVPYLRPTSPETPTVPSQPTTPGQTTPGQTTPGQTTPGQTTPGQTTPGMTMPGQMLPTGQPTTIGPGPGGQTALLSYSPAVFDTGSLNSTAGAYVRFSNRLGVAASGGYGVSGALTDAGRQYVGYAYGPYAGASLSYNLSRTDGMATSASASDTVTWGLCVFATPHPTDAPYATCREEVPSASLMESYRHKLSQTASLSISGGVSATVAQTPDLKEVVIVPNATATYSDAFGPNGRSSYSVSLIVGPMVDLRTGLPSTDFQASATLRDRLAAKVAVSGSLYVIQSLPFLSQDLYPLTSISAGIDARYRVDPLVDVAIGETIGWQQQYLPQTVQDVSSVLLSETTYVSVTARTLPLHF
jgi:hypothetical protein